MKALRLILVLDSERRLWLIELCPTGRFVMLLLADSLLRFIPMARGGWLCVQGIFAGIDDEQ